MRTIQIFLIVVTTVVCIGVGFYITWVNRGYQKRKADEAAARKQQQQGTQEPNSTPG